MSAVEAANTPAQLFLDRLEASDIGGRVDYSATDAKTKLLDEYSSSARVTEFRRYA